MHDVQTATHQTTGGQDYVALPWRSETILGVCEALGEDFGVNPNWLRVALAASVLVSPAYAVGVYFALGALVLLSRLLFPKAIPAAVSAPHVVAEQSVIAGAAPSPQPQPEKVPLAA